MMMNTEVTTFMAVNKALKNHSKYVRMDMQKFEIGR